MISRNNPDFNTALNVMKDNIFATLNCVQVGRIESYDQSAQTASIALQVKARINEESIIEYPLLVDCPVIVMQGGGAFLEFPISSGDFCLVLFNDRDIDTWFTSGNVMAPNTRRKHHLSDGFALVGVNPSTGLLDLDGVAQLTGPSKLAEYAILGETFKTNLTTFLNSVVTATATVGTEAQNAVALAAIGTAAGTLLSALSGILSTEVKIG